MIAAARKFNRVVQVGSQARSAKPAHDACQFIRNGRLGRVHTVKCWHTLNPVGGTEPDAEPPPSLDWDLWLGPLPWRPYSAAYCPGSFRWFLESGGGVIRDRGAHCFSIIRWCLDADRQSPVTVEATGTPPPKGLWDCPPEMKVVYTFKNPDWQLIWEQPGEKLGRADFGIVFHGEKDKLVVNRDGTQIDAERKALEFQVPPGGGACEARGQTHRLQPQSQGGLVQRHQDWSAPDHGYRVRPRRRHALHPRKPLLHPRAQVALGWCPGAHPRRRIRQPVAEPSATVSLPRVNSPRM